MKENIEKYQEEEREFAEENCYYDDGIPFISAIGDAWWSKRCYNYNFTTNSSARIIIGAYTRKILYLGIRNKYCK